MSYPHNDIMREEFLEANVRNAVEIALGRKFGVLSPIQGMGTPGTVHNLVTPESLQTLQANVENRIGNQDALINFLMSWTPLVQRIKESPGFKEIVREKIAQASEKFTQADVEPWATRAALVDELYSLINQERAQATARRHPMCTPTRSGGNLLESERDSRILNLGLHGR
jgi:hypothetical protein